MFKDLFISNNNNTLSYFYFTAQLRVFKLKMILIYTFKV